MKSATIFSNDFNRIISATKDFVGGKYSRTENQYIKLEFDSKENKVTATALDGYRLSVETAIISDCDSDFVCYVKANVKLKSEIFATIEFDEENKEAIIRCGEFSFGYNQPEIGEPFDWRKAIPESEIKYKIAFNGNYLLSALKAAKSSCGGSFQDRVVLEFRSNLEPIILRTGENNIKLVLPVRCRDWEESK